MSALGRGEAAAEWLADAFGEVSADAEVTIPQRRLWTIAAQGGFGTAGRDRLIQGLSPVVPEALPGEWLHRIAPRPAGSALFSLSAAAAQQLGAAAQLSQLRAACERLASPSDTVEQDGAADVRELLGLLVFEGSPPERDLLARARELRRVIAPEGERPEAEGDTGKTFQELLLDDLAGEDAALAGLAYRVAAPAIAVAAGSLATAAAEAPVRELTTRIGPDSITLRTDGPSPESMSVAERRIVGSGQVEKGSRAAAYVLLGTGVACLLLGLAQWGFVVLGLILAGVGGALLIARIRTDQETAKRRRNASRNG